MLKWKKKITNNIHWQSENNLRYWMTDRKREIKTYQTKYVDRQTTEHIE